MKNVSGFSLIEVLIVIAILALLIAIIVGAIGNDSAEMIGTEEGAKQALISAGYSSPKLLESDYDYYSDENYYYKFKATNPSDKVVDVTVTHKWKKGYTIRFE